MRTSVRRGIALVAGLAFASAGVMATAVPASAGTDAEIVLKRGGVWWKSYGDKFTVKDRLADGYWVQGIFRINGRAEHWVDNKRGAGEEVTWTYDAPEDQLIEIKMCYMDEVVTLWCTGWAKGRT
ncbi:hypothetical protein ACH35V_22380 [Actinomadura sp. 1N219]|uniref:hypothetical protein n=1 Tax=Actinomadura sp. 1N219 TaxID=3375152 RepID=UPI003791C94D